MNDNLDIVEFIVYGKDALFTEPFSKNGGEKTTSLIPTYDAIRGIAESIYWKPSIRIEILKVRVLNHIQTRSKGVLTLHYTGGKGLSNYTYLQDVAYQVQARLFINYNRPDFAHDFNMDKHYSIFKRSIKKGGRRDVFLGTRDCTAYVEPCTFGSGEGYYDGSGEIDYGLSVHSIEYPDNSIDNQFATRFWNAKMVDGIIYYPKPEACDIKRKLSTKEYSFAPTTIKSVDEEFQLTLKDGEAD